VVVTRHTEVQKLCREQGVDCMLHDLPERSDTVRLGLSALGDVDGCLFCPGDQPLLTQETVAALLLCARSAPEAIWRTACAGEPGAPVLFPSWAFPELLSLPAGKGGGHVAKKHPEQVRLLPVRDAFELMDADTPAALRLLAEH
jgi:molybdenum cofactor cytidylyltransferase